MSSRTFFALIVACAACTQRAEPPSRLPQAAYVWQRHWTPAVRAAVAQPSAALDALDVLVGEVRAGEASIALVSVDAVSLAASHRRVTLVVRIGGSRLADVSLAPVSELARTLRAAGVDVAGVQIDHDCATAQLPAYGAWLARQRPPDGTFSITALPTWANGDVASVAAAVDEIVLQVHAVRAPLIFDGSVAHRDLVRFARAVPGTPLRVALPTYMAVVRGNEVRVDPRDVLAFVQRLEAQPVPGVVGLVWFRLPVADDAQTWSAATFARVVNERTASGPQARVALVARGAAQFDIVAFNDGEGPVNLPPIRIEGAIAAADLVGYREVRHGQWDAPSRSLGKHDRIVLGWIRGTELALVE